MTLGEDDDATHRSRPTCPSGAVQEVDGVRRFVQHENGGHVGREVESSTEQAGRDKHSGLGGFRVGSVDVDPVPDGFGRRFDGQVRGRVVLCLNQTLELRARVQQEVRDVLVGSSHSTFRLGRDDLVSPAFLIKILAEVLRLAVFVGEDEDLRSGVPIPSILDECSSNLHQDVRQPISSGPGDSSDREVMRQLVEVGSDESNRFRMSLLEKLGEGFGNGGRRKDRSNGSGVLSLHQRLDDRQKISREVSV